MRHEPSSAVPDALLVERMALLRDEEAAADLFERHGLRLYAIAYGLLFEAFEAQAAVACAFRDARDSVPAIDPSCQSVASWLSALTRRRANQLLAERALRARVVAPEMLAQLDAVVI
jgi:DNA-directed RNA polymerase specialized sigma24 family protein